MDVCRRGQAQQAVKVEHPWQLGHDESADRDDSSAGLVVENVN